jgi:hypothetical protein
VGRQAALAAAPGLRLNVYNNAVDLIDQPSMRTRAFFWEIARSAIPLSGSLSWWSDTCWSATVSPWDTDGIGAAADGDGVMFYPPPTWYNRSAPSATPFAPVSSLRWEQLTLGLQDAELIKLSMDANASATLDVLSLVSWGMPRVSPANDQPFTVDVEVLEYARGRLAALALAPQQGE